MRNAFALSIFAIIALAVGMLSTIRPLTGGISSYPSSSGSGISSVAIENDGSAVGSEATINFVPGTYTTVTATDAGSKINVTIDADPSLSVAPIYLPLGTCNTGPTYVGGAWFFSAGVAPSCSTLFSGSFTALNIPRMNWDTQNDETVAAFMWPAAAGTSVTFRGKFTYSLTTTPVLAASIGCHADNGDMTTSPTSPAEITPVNLSFSIVWTTANRLNEGTVTLTDAAFVSGKACWLKLKRTDAGGGNLFMHNLPRLEF